MGVADVCTVDVSAVVASVRPNSYCGRSSFSIDIAAVVVDVGFWYLSLRA